MHGQDKVGVVVTVGALLVSDVVLASGVVSIYSTSIMKHKEKEKNIFIYCKCDISNVNEALGRDKEYM